MSARGQLIIKLSNFEGLMLYLTDTNNFVHRFVTQKGLKEYIETRHVEAGGFDWISEIKDDKGKYYGCCWSLELMEI